MTDNNARLSWQVAEYTHKEKGPDWFWALGVVIVAGIVIAVVTDNIFFAIFLLLGGILLGWYANKKPDILDVALYEDGVVVDEYLYPFKKIKGFAIDVHPLSSYLLLEYERALFPIVSVPLPQNIDIEELRTLLKTKTPEKELAEPLSHKILEHLGF